MDGGDYNISLQYPLHFLKKRGDKNYIQHRTTPDRRKSKHYRVLSTTVDESIVRNSVFYCHLPPDWRQMPIENTVSSDFYSRLSIAAYPV